MHLPLDIELAIGLQTMSVGSPHNYEQLQAMRKNDSLRSAADVLTNFPDIKHDEYSIPAPAGEIMVSVFRRHTLPQRSTGTLGILYIHPGGMILGNRFLDVATALEWVQAFGAVCVAVEYRLAPEHPGFAPLDDCFAALEWMSQNAQLLFFDSALLMVLGISGGGGLAAGLGLRSLHRNGPQIAVQVLVCPMLDPDNNSTSATQGAPLGLWDSTANSYAWDCVLGTQHQAREISAYLAPCRATKAELIGLPPTFIDVGESEIFRDECVAYASKLWAAGVSTELHVWQGGFHGFDLNVPSAAISMMARNIRTAWVTRWLERKVKTLNFAEFPQAGAELVKTGDELTKPGQGR
ncbi:hypothetical protein V502_03053 [Pseudogymnoascus sp. VKM F-4520 (FW-2644)]|nr:hypothetical protein V502_03053 [Pseudogymnoascus sp. VKM F-4520 (FW-2644)]